MHVAAVVEANWQDIRAVLGGGCVSRGAMTHVQVTCVRITMGQSTYNLSDKIPEYKKVLGPSAKVKGRGPDMSQSAVSGQNMVYVVATLSYPSTKCQ